jgi:hypothetical protein
MTSLPPWHHPNRENQARLLDNLEEAPEHHHQPQGSEQQPSQPPEVVNVDENRHLIQHQEAPHPLWRKPNRQHQWEWILMFQKRDRANRMRTQATKCTPKIPKNPRESMGWLQTRKKRPHRKIRDNHVRTTQEGTMEDVIGRPEEYAEE